MATTATPRIVIAGVTSGVGKTTVAAGLIGALQARGLQVQPYKCGPDYIDPSYLNQAAQRVTRNLDSWILPNNVVRELFARSAADADAAVIEGMMGLYDGRTGEGEVGSTAHIAKLLGAPVVLVLDASKVGRSAAATVLGFQRFDPALALKGVIINQVAGERHRQIVTEAIEAATGLPVLGALPKSDAFHLAERHLGLVPAPEDPDAGKRVEALTAAINEHCDIDKLWEIAQSAPPVEAAPTRLFPKTPPKPRPRIGVALDSAFSFYYQDNLDLLEAWGAELVPFSPLADERLAESIHGLYIGGGFPEVYAQELTANRLLMEDIRRRAAAGMPVFGECGGLMYLSEGIKDFEGKLHTMVGLIPGVCVMERRRVGLGYLTVESSQPSFLVPRGEKVRAHEFHWSRLEHAFPLERTAFRVQGPSERLEGFTDMNILASYVHFHFGANVELAPRLVAACSAWSEGE